ncbi:uncharacterized protein PSANT_04381 [Moesziomyces antarcticus]|nr:uncharacterized protein PSANT_04381 [Moesziomyces antarcticus]
MPASDGEDDSYSTELDPAYQLFNEDPELLCFCDLEDYDDVEAALESRAEILEEDIEEYEAEAEKVRWDLRHRMGLYDQQYLQNLSQNSSRARQAVELLRPRITQLVSQLDIFRKAHLLRDKMAEDQAAEERRMDEIASLPELASTPQEASATSDLQAAWERKDYELVVQLASTLIEDTSGAPGRDDLDGVRQLCSGLRLRHKAYGAMRLYTLGYGDATRLAELLSTFGAEVQAEDGLEMESTAANQSESATRRRSARISQSRGQKRSATPKANAGHPSKRSKIAQAGQPKHTSKSERISIIHFPVELILMIANHLSITDRLHLANTCHDWRRIPQLWQSLKFKRIKGIGREGWHRDTVQICVAAIEICQRRSRGALTCVRLKGFVTPSNVGPILDVLGLSSASLQHVAIPTLDQKLCFDRLYYRCPNLTDIDVRFACTAEATVVSQEAHRITSPFESDTLPFQLRSFYSRSDLPYGPLTSHMKGLRVVRSMAYKRQKKLSFVEGLLRAAPTLVEWWDDIGSDWYHSTVNLGDYGIERTPSSPLVFPKLRRLNALWSEIFLDCEFPALREARINSVRGPSTLEPSTSETFSRAAAIIAASPLLKKLEILLPAGVAAQKQIYVAIGKLRHLEDLTLTSTDNSLSLRTLLSAEEQLATPKSPSQEIMPSLHTLRLVLKTSGRGNEAVVSDLVEMLLIRYYRREGHPYQEAKEKMRQARQAHRTYQLSLTKPPKPPKPPAKKTAKKKKGASDAAEDALETKEDVKPPTFAPVLPQLVLPSEKVYDRGEMRSWWKTSESLLSQLVFQVVEAENPREYNESTRSGSRAYY